MSINNWIGGNIGGTFSSGTNFFGFANVNSFQSSTETDVRSKYPAGTSSMLSVFIGSVVGTPTMTARFRKNTANGNQVVTSSAGGTGWQQDTTHSDTTVDGDQVAGALAPSGASCTMAGSASILFVHATDGVQIYQTNASVNLASGNDGNESAFGGTMAFDLASVNRRTQLQTATTLSHLIAVVTNQASTGTIVIITRKNGFNANQTVSFATGVNGDAEDTTHTDSFASTDQGSFSYSGITSAFVGARSIKVRANNSGNAPADTISTTETGANSSVYTTYFISPSGGSTDQKNATETLAETKAPIQIGTHSLRMHIRNGTTNQSLNLTARKNGASASQTVTLAAGTNGWATDATHSDTFSAGDLASFMFTTTSTTGTYQLLAGGWTTDLGVSVETGAGLMSFGGIALSGHIVKNEGAGGAMHFAGVTINGHAARTETNTGALHFAGITIAAVGHVISEILNGAMHFAGITIRAAGFDYGAPGTGKVHFWTFGA